jgi:hypothetical protein
VRIAGVRRGMPTRSSMAVAPRSASRRRVRVPPERLRHLAEDRIGGIERCPWLLGNHADVNALRRSSSNDAPASSRSGDHDRLASARPGAGTRPRTQRSSISGTDSPTRPTTSPAPLRTRCRTRSPSVARTRERSPSACEPRGRRRRRLPHELGRIEAGDTRALNAGPGGVPYDLAVRRRALNEHGEKDRDAWPHGMVRGRGDPRWSSITPQLRGRWRRRDRGTTSVASASTAAANSTVAWTRMTGTRLGRMWCRMIRAPPDPDASRRRRPPPRRASRRAPSRIRSANTSPTASIEISTLVRPRRPRRWRPHRRDAQDDLDGADRASIPPPAEVAGNQAERHTQHDRDADGLDGREQRHPCTGEQTLSSSRPNWSVPNQ